MKKILSLLALLVTTVAAMAFDFTDHRVVQLNTLPKTETDNATITVTQNDNGNYDVVFKNIQNVDGSYTDSYGDYTFTNVPGTTEGGVTTISGENLNASVANGEYSFTEMNNGKLLVKFTEDPAKAYADMAIDCVYWGMAFNFKVQFGTDDFPTSGGTATEETLWENYQADGNGFSKNVTIDWDTQKIVASIDFSNGGDDKDILAMTTGESFTSFQTSDYHTMHWYCNQSSAQMSGFFAQAGQSNNNTGRIDVANCLAKFEITKAEGLKVNGSTKMSADALAELFASNSLLIGSGESPKFSKAYYNYIKIVPLDWTETEPFTPVTFSKTDVANVTYNGTTTNLDEANVELTEYEEGKYKLTWKNFTVGTTTIGDFTIDDVTVAKDVTSSEYSLTTTATEGTWSNLQSAQLAGMLGIEEGGKAAISGFEGTYTLNDAADAIESLKAKFNVTVMGSEANIVFGEQAFIPVTTTYTNVANVKFGDNYTNFDDAQVDLTEVAEGKYTLTYKNLTVDSNVIGDFAIADVTASVTDEGTVFSTTATDGTWTRVEENNAASVEAGSTVAIRDFEAKLAAAAVQDATAASTLTAKFGVNITGEWADVVFGEKHEEEVEEYPINFDKTQQNNHGSRYTTSVSLQQEGKEVQTISVNSVKDAYEDLSAQSFTVEAGSTVTPTLGYNGEWMHAYVYIDENNDKQFSWNADGDDQTGTELVSFSYYQGKNSKGEATEANVNATAAPSFTAPAVPGTYRMRYKIDWDNVDPGGNVASGNHIANNGGGIWDVTLVVTEPAPTVVDSKAFTDGKLVVGTSPLDEGTTYENKNLMIEKYSDGTYTLTFRKFPVSATETENVSFHGQATESTENGENYLNGEELTGTVNGKEVTFIFTASIKDDIIDLQYEFGNEDESVYYIGTYNNDPTNAISGINADVENGKAEIFTLNGSKVSKLQRGVNIVRTADGKTKKVVLK